MNQWAQSTPAILALQSSPKSSSKSSKSASSKSPSDVLTPSNFPSLLSQVSASSSKSSASSTELESLRSELCQLRGDLDQACTTIKDLSSKLSTINATVQIHDAFHDKLRSWNVQEISTMYKRYIDDHDRLCQELQLCALVPNLTNDAWRNLIRCVTQTESQLSQVSLTVNKQRQHL